YRPPGEAAMKRAPPRYQLSLFGVSAVRKRLSLQPCPGPTEALHRHRLAQEREGFEQRQANRAAGHRDPYRSLGRGKLAVVRGADRRQAVLEDLRLPRFQL